MGELLSVAQKALLAGALPVKRLFGDELKRLGARYKRKDKSLQTAIDRDAEKAILGVIRNSLFANDCIQAEESGRSAGKTSRVWYIDPFDGTANIPVRIPECTMGLSIRENGNMAVGIVLHPFEMRMIYAEKGKGAWKVPLRLENEKMIIYGDPVLLEPRRAPYLPRLRHMWVDGHWTGNNAGRKSAWLSQAHKFALNVLECGSNIDKPAKIAEGRGHFMFTDAVGGFHDLGPGIVILGEVGGKYTDMFGNEPSPSPLTQLVVGCVDTRFHGQLLELTQKHYGPKSKFGRYKGFMA